MPINVNEVIATTQLLDRRLDFRRQERASETELTPTRKGRLQKKTGASQVSGV